MKVFLFIFLSVAIFFGQHRSFVIAAESTPILPREEWSFSGPFGVFDRAQLQRGFQVYKEVCSACHALVYLTYKDLTALGFSEAEVKAIAAQYTTKDGPNDQGEFFDRPAIISDRFFNPYPNEQAARAANDGALPVDQSLIIKARAGGADYVYALLTGYADSPPGFELPKGRFYNTYFPGHAIAMPPPLGDGQVTYSDGTKATIAQMSKDVTAFLTWAADPYMETRKRLGIRTVLFLSVFTALLYVVMRRIWRRAK